MTEWNIDLKRGMINPQIIEIQPGVYSFIVETETPRTEHNQADKIYLEEKAREYLTHYLGYRPKTYKQVVEELNKRKGLTPKAKQTVSESASVTLDPVD